MPGTTKRLGRPGDLGPLEQGIGWASLALGLPQAVDPAAFARFVGAPDGPRAQLVLRTACAPRELAAAAGVLAAERPWPRRTLWARVAGDALDVGLLVASWRSTAPRDPARLAAAGVAALAIGTADVLAALRAKEQEDADTPPATVKEHPKLRRIGVTVRAPRDEVEQAWEAWDGTAPREAASFVIAPGGRGTEVRVDLGTGPGGAAALLQAARKVTGGSYDEQVANDLRRFKQVIEAGEVLRSDGSPEGPTGPRLRKQRPAQPTESR